MWSTKYWVMSLFFLSLILFACQSSEETAAVFEFVEVEIPSADGITLKGDFYAAADKDSPFILLCHQAGYSRGEYREIAPKLNALGYHCLAIDQRSGDEVNGVKNEAAAEAEAKRLGTAYPDAYVDIDAALEFVKSEYQPAKLILWGSSYSAALSLIFASQAKADAVIAFSPGEYFEYEGKSITQWASEIQIPIFVTSSRSESGDLKKIFDKIPALAKKMFTPSSQGKHGSKALYKKEAASSQYWEAIENFLAGN